MRHYRPATNKRCSDSATRACWCCLTAASKSASLRSPAANDSASATISASGSAPPGAPSRTRMPRSGYRNPAAAGPVRRYSSRRFYRDCTLHAAHLNSGRPRDFANGHQVRIASRNASASTSVRLTITCSPCGGCGRARRRISPTGSSQLSAPVCSRRGEAISTIRLRQVPDFKGAVPVDRFLEHQAIVNCQIRRFSEPVAAR